MRTSRLEIEWPTVDSMPKFQRQRERRREGQNNDSDYNVLHVLYCRELTDRENPV